MNLLISKSVVSTLAILSLPAVGLALPVVRTGSGATPADITAIRNQFRLDLGGGNVAGANGLFQDATGARREINWDGVPDGLSAPNNLPANFFNVNSPRGAVFSTPGTGFQVSGKVGVAPIRFENLRAGYSSDFSAFTEQRLFTALDSNITSIAFFEPGTNTLAFVKGFGSIFSDVDLIDSTRIDYFDENNALIHSQPVPISGAVDGGFSFAGVSFDGGELISRVQIVSGNTNLGPQQSGQDADFVAGFDPVVMDDFLYSNPAVPEPATLGLIGMAAAGLMTRRRRN